MESRRGQKPSLLLVVAGGIVEVCPSPVSARFGIFCLENPFMSRFSLSVTVIDFPHYMVTIRYFFSCASYSKVLYCTVKIIYGVYVDIV